jgi:hypothetical protein
VKVEKCYFFKKRLLRLGWGAKPDSIDFVYFLIPSLYRSSAATPQLENRLNINGLQNIE